MFSRIKLSVKHIAAIVVMAIAVIFFAIFKMKSGARAIRKANASVVRSRLRMVEQYSDLASSTISSNVETSDKLEEEVVLLQAKIDETERLLDDETKEIRNADIEWIDHFFASRGL